LIIGFFEKRRGSYQIKDLTGLQGPAPVLAAIFTVVMLASIGLPGLSGFVSEYLILIGTFGTHAWWAAVATLGVVAAAVYLLWAYQRVFHGRPRARTPRSPTRRQGAVGAGARRGADRRARRLPAPGARSHHALGPATHPPRRAGGGEQVSVS
jgi:formate hydrogenlyase subunit 3/multisubunit Na+/H+ antiporter MnhD subunit